MRILAFDTATAACSAAVWDAGDIAARRFEAMARGHAERLMPMIADVLAEAGVGYDDLDLVAVTRGPGAFTGLRIGLAAARGLALAGSLPCLAVTTLETVAAQVPAAEREGATVLVTLETKRADVYAQAFSAGLAPIGEPRAVPPDGLADVIGDRAGAGDLVVAGDAAGRARDALSALGIGAALSGAPGLPDAATVARLAAERHRQGAETPPPRPLYLSPPRATLPTKEGRLRP